MGLRPKVSKAPEPLDDEGKGKDNSKGQGNSKGKDNSKGQGKNIGKSNGKAEHGPRDELFPPLPDAAWLQARIRQEFLGPRVGRCKSEAKVHRDLCHAHWSRFSGPKLQFLEWYGWVKQLV